MKQLFMALIGVLLPHFCMAEKYQVLEVNEGDYIVVKKRQVRVRDFFDDGDELSLSATQVVAVRNVKTKRRSVIIGKNFVERGRKTLKSYFFPTRNTVSRDYYDGLRDFIGDELVWVDSLAIQTKLPPSYERVFVMEILLDDGSIVERFLNSEKKCTRICFDSQSIWNDSIPHPLIFNLKAGTYDKYTQEGKYETICTNVKLTPLTCLKKDEED